MGAGIDLSARSSLTNRMGLEKIWVHKWTELPEASAACHALIHCGCKKSCQGLCKCF